MVAFLSKHQLKDLLRFRLSAPYVEEMANGNGKKNSPFTLQREKKTMKNYLFLLSMIFLISCSGDSSTQPENGPEQEQGQEVGETEEVLPSPCTVGQELGPGEKCLVGDDDIFEVWEGGTGCYKIYYADGGERWQCDGEGIDLEGFVASIIEDSDRWKIEKLP